MDDDDIFMNIYPPEYRSEYLNGYHFGRAENPFGKLFWLDDEGCTYLRRFGLALLLRAKNEIDALNSEFPHPYEPKCRELKESGDEEGFFRFRDRIYHSISFAGAGLSYQIEDMAEAVRDQYDTYFRIAGL